MILDMIAETVILPGGVKAPRQLVAEGDLYARGRRYRTTRSVVVPRVHSPTPDGADHSVVNNSNKLANVCQTLLHKVM